MDFLMTVFIKFENIDLFDEWHDLVKEQLNLPYQDGTTDYTMPRIRKDGKVIAAVDGQIDYSDFETIEDEQAVIQGYIPTINGYMEF